MLQALSALESCKLHLHHGNEEEKARNKIEAAETNLRKELQVKLKRALLFLHGKS